MLVRASKSAPSTLAHAGCRWDTDGAGFISEAQFQAPGALLDFLRSYLLVGQDGTIASPAQAEQAEVHVGVAEIAEVAEEINVAASMTPVGAASVAQPAGRTVTLPVAGDTGCEMPELEYVARL